MTSFLVKYLVFWLACCVLGLVIAIKDVRPVWRDELAFLTVPWKLALFIPAIVFVTFAGRYTNDETWDTVCGGSMSLLTVLTSGWAVGTAYKVFSGERPASHLVVAVVVALFSSSWFYDGYLLLRDGAYTQRWFGNLRLSPIIYACAGTLLNLEVRGKGLGFGPTRAEWPRPASTQSSWLLALASIPLVLIAAYILVAYVGWSRTPTGAQQNTRRP